MKSRSWNRGDIVLNVVENRTAHFDLQVGYDGEEAAYIQVLPHDGESHGDVEWWDVTVVKWVCPFTILRVVK